MPNDGTVQKDGPQLHEPALEDHQGRRSEHSGVLDDGVHEYSGHG